MKNLINLSGGDRLNLRVEDQILLSESVKNGKTRQTQKEFASIDEAQKACAKKEWEGLKKGYVLQNMGAKAGEASLHIYIGGGYTGALAFAGAEGDLFVYKCGGYKEGGALDDFLIRLDASGAVKQQIVLPKPLAWRAERAGEILLLDLDHFIFKFDPATGEFSDLSQGLSFKNSKEFTSFVCAAKDTAAFAMFGQIFILRDGEISLLTQYKAEMKSSTPIFCIALSADGSRLAIISYGKAHIVDLKSANLTPSFELEHVVKRCEAKFENSNGSKNLAVRTDYGCFSLYRV
ncbi:hypothetical protein [uncultured Campylobacter sp.]|uniref:hypothetical protein n=1 Tax=uncultured Campylobacter sp. TaxID=218934 RepID=UPI002620AC7C|nr:hypothetical protein [uncultured Campylobacter sp.]